MKKTLTKIDSLVSEALALLEELANEKREAFDNMSEKRQEGEAGQKVSDLADSLEAARDELENAQSSIQALIE